MTMLLLFNRYDFTRNGSTAAAGLAYLSALCTDQSVSVVEDHFNFNLLTTAAHELGHRYITCLFHEKHCRCI